MTSTPQVWDGVLRRLQSELPAFSFDAWFAPLVPKAHDGGLVLLCPSSFHRDRIRNHYLTTISRYLTEAGAGIGIELRVADEPEPAITQVPRRTDAAIAPGVGEGEAAPVPLMPVKHHDVRVARSSVVAITKPRPLAGGEGAERASAEVGSQPTEPPSPALLHTFDSFVVGPCNALAREASIAIARNQQSSLQQLYICSRPGMGKTHLSKAVAAEAKRLGSDAVRYVAAESFTNEFLAALRSRETDAFKRRYRRRRQLLVVEDIQFLQSKDATQLEFFHTVAHVLDTGGRVVLTGDRMPHELGGMSPRIRSQLGTGFVAELEPPDATVRRAILRSKAARGGVRLPSECLDMLVDAVSGSVRDVESVLIQLVTTASLLKRPIDTELTQGAIAKKVPNAERRRPRLDVETVVRVVAGFFKTHSEALASKSRGKNVLVPRQLAMYLCRRYTDGSITDIGKALRRNHPSVRNAIGKIERDILERPRVRYQVEALSARLDELLLE